jgi:hypothetical protein
VFDIREGIDQCGLHLHILVTNVPTETPQLAVLVYLGAGQVPQPVLVGEQGGFEVVEHVGGEREHLGFHRRNGCALRID